MVMEDFTIDLKKFEKFISWSMKCQEPLIRGAAQESVLRMLINISDSEKICPNDPNVEILNLFRGKNGILIRGTDLHLEASDWLITKRDQDHSMIRDNAPHQTTLSQKRYVHLRQRYADERTLITALR